MTPVTDVDRPLMLLDSAGLWFRAVYAIPDRTFTDDGRSVNAVRGFMDMTSQLIAKHRPQRLVACLDLNWRPDFRVALLPSYKAHRVATGGGEDAPEHLGPQVEMIYEVLAAIGIPTAGAPDCEADDVLGTLAAEEPRVPVIVVSGDRDLLQVADDGVRPVRCLYIGRGLGRAEMFGPAEIAEKYGVPADRAARAYAELALLRGDPSDGLPGVPGIGEKTASKLLLAYGSLAAIRRAAAAQPSPLTARVAGSLRDSADYLDAAWDVVWVRRDAPVTVSGPDGLPVLPAHPERLAELAQRYRLTAQVARLQAALDAAHR